MPQLFKYHAVTHVLQSSLHSIMNLSYPRPLGMSRMTSGRGEANGPYGETRLNITGLKRKVKTSWPDSFHCIFTRKHKRFYGKDIRRCILESQVLCRRARKMPSRAFRHMRIAPRTRISSRQIMTSWLQRPWVSSKHVNFVHEKTGGKRRKVYSFKDYISLFK